MKTVYFVRHAQPNYENHVDALRELTEKGQADTALVSAFLRDKNVDLVLSSPYLRAIETIRAFAQEAGLPIEQIDDFRERKVGNGWIENFDEFAQRQWEDFSYKLPGGESLSEVQDRNLHALKEAFHRWPESRCIAIGSHGTALSTVIHACQPKFGYGEFFRMAKMPWIVEFHFEGEKCLSIVSHDLFEKSRETILG